MQFEEKAEAEKVDAESTIFAKLQTEFATKAALAMKDALNHVSDKDEQESIQAAAKAQQTQAEMAMRQATTAHDAAVQAASAATEAEAMAAKTGAEAEAKMESMKEAKKSFIQAQADAHKAMQAAQVAVHELKRATANITDSESVLHWIMKYAHAAADAEATAAYAEMTETALVQVRAEVRAAAAATEAAMTAVAVAARVEAKASEIAKGAREALELANNELIDAKSLANAKEMAVIHAADAAAATGRMDLETAMAAAKAATQAAHAEVAARALAKAECVQAASKAEGAKAEAMAELQARISMQAVAESFEAEKYDELKMKVRAAELAVKAAAKAEASTTAIDGLFVHLDVTSSAKADAEHAIAETAKRMAEQVIHDTHLHAELEWLLIFSQ